MAVGGGLRRRPAAAERRGRALAPAGGPGSPIEHSCSREKCGLGGVVVESSFSSPPLLLLFAASYNQESYGSLAAFTGEPEPGS